jgi:hypothetical protein
MIGLLLAAEIAFSAIQIRIYCHTITALQRSYLPARFHNPPNEFMSCDHREFTVIFVAEYMHIGPANPNLGHLN